MKKIINYIIKIFFLSIVVYFLIGACTIYDDNIQVSKYTIKSKKISSDFDGAKILQITDLHDGLFGKNQKKLIDKIDSIKPDIVVFTGDMYDKSQEYKNADLLMREVSQKYNCYYVTGNHERAVKGFTEKFNDIKSYGINILSGSTDIIKKGDSKITISGMSDISFYGNLQKLKSATNKLNINKDLFNVMLYHKPQDADIFGERGYDLIMSGHRHGGQVRLFGYGLYSPEDGWFPTRTKGEYSIGKSKLIVSAGLCLRYRSRVYNPPEMVLVTLKK